MKITFKKQTGLKKGSTSVLIDGDKMAAIVKCWDGCTLYTIVAKSEEFNKFQGMEFETESAARQFIKNIR